MIVLLLTHPKIACMTSKIAKLCTIAVCFPIRAYVVVALWRISTNGVGRVAANEASLEALGNLRKRTGAER